MWALLAALFEFVSDVYRRWRESQLIEQGRGAVEQEAKDNASAVVVSADVPDPGRDQRLRNRFDRSASGKDQAS
jgi:hypothetical protein